MYFRLFTLTVRGTCVGTCVCLQGLYLAMFDVHIFIFASLCLCVCVCVCVLMRVHMRVHAQMHVWVRVVALDMD